jgi:hypothetical protein
MGGVVHTPTKQPMTPRSALKSPMTPRSKARAVAFEAVPDLIAHPERRTPFKVRAIRELACARMPHICTRRRTSFEVRAAERSPAHTRPMFARIAHVAA